MIEDGVMRRATQKRGSDRVSARIRASACVDDLLSVTALDARSYHRGCLIATDREPVDVQ